MNKQMRVEMPDGSIWAVPVDIIARNRAECYKDEFDDDIEKSLAEDTLPLFEQDDYAIEDWAANNMNWEDVQSVAVLVRQSECDYQKGWLNGDKTIVSP